MGLRELLTGLEESGLERTTVDARPRPDGRIVLDGRELLDLSSNDYLGMAGRPDLARVLGQAAQEWGTGAGAARLLSGSRSPMSRLEEAFAVGTGFESALLFNSGYHANAGILAALTTSDSLIFSDQYNHASLIDGCRLASAQVRVYPHRDLKTLEEMLRSARATGDLKASGPHFLVTEGVFSMDGEQPDPASLVHLKDEYGLLLYVDDAHGFGVLGDGGNGAFHQVLDRVDLLVATFGKALGVAGAAVGAGTDVIRLLRSRARSFIFTTAMPPALAVAALESLAMVAGDEGREARRKLGDNCRLFQTGLRKAGIAIPSNCHHIVPIYLQDEKRAVEASHGLLDAGVFCRAVRFPTVPLGTARLRCSISASHTPEALKRAAHIIADICKGG